MRTTRVSSTIAARLSKLACQLGIGVVGHDDRRAGAGTEHRLEHTPAVMLARIAACDGYSGCIGVALSGVQPGRARSRRCCRVAVANGGDRPPAVVLELGVPVDDEGVGRSPSRARRTAARCRHRSSFLEPPLADAPPRTTPRRGSAGSRTFTASGLLRRAAHALARRRAPWSRCSRGRSAALVSAGGGPGRNWSARVEHPGLGRARTGRRGAAWSGSRCRAS